MASRQILIAGNWKMNKTASEAAELVGEIKRGLTGSGRYNSELLVCPPFVSIPAAVDAAEGRLNVGGQNLHWEDSGAFTGEISGPMLKGIGCLYVIIGHSERRQYFGETNETVNKRIFAAIRNDLQPILCVGETLEEREAGHTSQVVLEQVKQGLQGMNADQLARLVIAYEPVWAIGTGKTATSDQAQEVHKLIREQLTNDFGLDFSESVRILYGGSMKPGNAGELLDRPDIDGGLIGGASLKAEDFLGIAAGAK
jgi:triosephosphate isomerase